MAQREEHDKRPRLVDPTLELQEIAHATFPELLTSFVGRSEEIAAVETFLTRPGARLVTLTGTGGIGKTRLALGVAVQLQDSFADGVWFVSLAAITDPELVVPSIARILRVGEQPNKPVLDLLAEHLRGRQLLLVLDNFEHVIAAATDIARLLASCPDLRVLVTSRESLRLGGEREYPVLPLPVSANPAEAGMDMADGDAVRLFVDRATHVVPDFEITDENAPVIVEICRRLDGLPLALELAAARVKVLSPEDLLVRLDQPLAVLTGGPRDAPTRQQTMRATLQWSYNLLPDLEQMTFRGLSVFSGGWTLAAAEAVVGSADTLSMLSLLVDKGLVRRIDRPGQPTRYGMLEPVRHFAWEQLTEHPDEVIDVSQLHADSFRTFVKGLQQRMDGPDGRAAGDRCEVEHDNLLAALHWFRENGQVEQALQLVGDFGNFWFQRGYINEGLAQIESTLTLPGASTPTIGRARALWSASWHRLSQRDIQAAYQHIEESHNIYEMLGDADGMALTRFVLGVCRQHLEDNEQALADFECALAMLRAVKKDSYVVRTQYHLAQLAIGRGDLDAARRYLDDGMALALAGGMKHVAAVLLLHLGQVAELSGEDGLAADLYAERLRLFYELGNEQFVAPTLERIAALVRRKGQFEPAVLLLGFASAVRERTGSANTGVNVCQELDHMRVELAAPVFEAAWERGQATPLDEAVNLALRALESIDSEGALRKMLPAGLTPREGEVLRLIVAGRSNREIAEALFLSPRTVERHIANIYLKIDVHSKAEATAYAKRQHLV